MITVEFHRDPPAETHNALSRHAFGWPTHGDGCTFCGTDPGRRWTRYPAEFTKRVVLPATEQVAALAYSGDWDACRKCAVHLDTGDFAKPLGRRIIACRPKPAQLTRHAWVSEIALLLTALEGHIGPGIPMQRPRGVHR